MWDAIGHLLNTFGGGAVVASALIVWIGSVQLNRLRERDRHAVEKKLQRLKDRIDRGQFVHRLQFETEFKAYLALWTKAVVLRKAALNLRPVHDYRSNKKSEADIDNERLSKLDEVRFDFIDHFATNQPFLANGVSFAATALSNLAFNEGIRFQIDKSHCDAEQYWKQAMANADKIGEAADKLCKAIRERIWIDEDQEGARND